MAVILGLISDLIYLHHPITLDIRWLFCQRLNSEGKCWDDDREAWERYIKDGCGDYTLSKFIKLLVFDKDFRGRVIDVLEKERNGLIQST